MIMRMNAMTQLASFVVAMLVAGAAMAQGAGCSTTADEKKLAGAARKSFLTKCEKTRCEATAREKKLAGAAKKSFEKKCLKDAMGG